MIKKKKISYYDYSHVILWYMHLKNIIKCSYENSQTLAIQKIYIKLISLLFFTMC